MFCNLLFNPQIRHLLALGQDLGLGAAQEIRALLSDGLEDAELLGRPLKRIAGSQRLFPAGAGFDTDRLRAQISFHDLGRLSEPDLGARLQRLLGELPKKGAVAPGERLRVEIPVEGADAGARRPSHVGVHDVRRYTPLECWRELVVRAARFGTPAQLGNGARLELLNVRAVIERPTDDDADALREHGFDLERFRAYQREMLEPALPDGIAYSYGNRLRGYFDQGSGADTLKTAVEILRSDRLSRRAYVSLWDSVEDLREGNGALPCLTTIFFRVSEERLTLTATYRAHNLLTAWLQNVYGLMAIQRHVAEATGVEPGALTVISHSLGIDPRSTRFELANAIAADWRSDDDRDLRTGKASLREDPHGYFIVSADAERGLILAEHRFDGVLVKRYEGERAAAVEHEIAADMAVSLVSHAMWLGRELARAEASLERAKR
jgi:thymidylate synthase